MTLVMMAACLLLVISVSASNNVVKNKESKFLDIYANAGGKA
jgi:hypothetical protein